MTVSWVSEMGTGSAIGSAHTMDHELLQGVIGSTSPGKRNRSAGSQRTRQEFSRRLWLHYFRHANVEGASSHEVVDTWV